MQSMSEAPEGRHSTMAGTLTNLIYHIVFSTKNRAALIPKEFRSKLYAYIKGIIDHHGGILLEVGGISDHVHLLMKLRAGHSVSELVRLIKANSSKWANEKAIQRNLFAWQGGYGAFTVSASGIEPMRKYIRTQEEHHRVKTFQEELVELLIKQGIEFETRYLWE